MQPEQNERVANRHTPVPHHGNAVELSRRRSSITAKKWPIEKLWCHVSPKQEGPGRGLPRAWDIVLTRQFGCTSAKRHLRLSRCVINQKVLLQRQHRVHFCFCLIVSHLSPRRNGPILGDSIYVYISDDSIYGPISGEWLINHRCDWFIHNLKHVFELICSNSAETPALDLFANNTSMA